MNALPILASARLHLRHGQTADIPDILSYYHTNHDYLAPFEPVKAASFYTETHWEALLKQRKLDTQHDRSLKLFLFLKASPHTLIGSLNFSNFTRGVFQNCAVGYSLAEAYQGQGYMTEALKVSIDYLFSQLHFHRIEANYLPHNQRSGNVLKRLGFSVHGYARDYLYIAGQWQDHVLTHLLNPAPVEPTSPTSLPSHASHSFSPASH